MLIQVIQDAIDGYDRSEKTWWQRLFGPPSTIKQLKLFLANLSILPLPVDLARELTDEEMFKLYNILLTQGNSEYRRTIGRIYLAFKSDEALQACTGWLKTPSAKILARVFCQNFCVVTLEILEDLKTTQELFTAVQRHAKPRALRASIETLKQNGLLTKALELLSDRSYLNQTRFNLVKQHADPEQLAKQTNPTTTDIKNYLAEYDQKKGFFRKYICRKTYRSSFRWGATRIESIF